MRNRHGIDPDVHRALYGDTITITSRSIPEVIRQVPDQTAVSLVDVVDVDTMGEHIIHQPDGDLGPNVYAQVGTTTVDPHFVSHDQLLAEPDDHVEGQDHPQGIGLYHTVVQGTGLRVNYVAVRWVVYNVELPICRWFLSQTRAHSLLASCSWRPSSFGISSTG